MRDAQRVAESVFQRVISTLDSTCRGVGETAEISSHITRARLFLSSLLSLFNFDTIQDENVVVLVPLFSPAINPTYSSLQGTLEEMTISCCALCHANGTLRNANDVIRSSLCTLTMYECDVNAV